MNLIIISMTKGEPNYQFTPECFATKLHVITKTNAGKQVTLKVNFETGVPLTMMAFASHHSTTPGLHCCKKQKSNQYNEA